MSYGPTGVGLLVDEGEWERAGEELRRVDPVRYVQLLRLAQRIVLAHVDPLASPPRDSLEVSGRGKGSA